MKRSMCRRIWPCLSLSTFGWVTRHHRLHGQRGAATRNQAIRSAAAPMLSDSRRQALVLEQLSKKGWVSRGRIHDLRGPSDLPCDLLSSSNPPSIAVSTFFQFPIAASSLVPLSHYSQAKQKRQWNLPIKVRRLQRPRSPSLR
jgi:hypothetical protein